ncbi:unnamed protein product [Plutella xylostella]|uniref:Protein CASC3 n=1 Tax=Plutella xylostella TaxID=51655 RepID=A0A8S4FTD5_PLUXY|nr:unnamed protein product [Plutella xylostella]
MTSVARRREQDDSGEYSDASQENGQNNSANDAPAPESDYDSRGSESDLSEKDQDGQEAEKRVDDDEDRSNPQYIPKRGTFYEHDDRTAASGEEPANPTASEAAVEKKESGPGAPPERRRPPRPSDTTNKWSHDKYHENEQMPKSRDELVSIYGYDIRNEDAPPHARRNRRYGRGPNKYTRTWEDEEAYKRQATAATPNRKPPNLEDFPELEAAGKRSNKKRPPRPRSKSQPNSEHSLENGTTELKRNASIKSPRSRDPVRKNPERIERTVVNKAPAPVGKQPERPDRMPAIERLTITANVNTSNGAAPQRKVNATVAQQRPVPTAQGKKPAPQPPAPQQNSSQPPAPSVKAQAPAPPQQPPTTQASAPTAEARGSKRYSSLRQRPLAEPYSPQQQQQQQQQQQPQQQQQHRYAEFPSNQQPAPAPAHQGSPAPPQQQIMHQVHRTPAVTQPQHGPSPPHQTIAQPHNQQQVRLGMMEQQLVQHPHHQIHNMPPHTMGNYRLVTVIRTTADTLAVNNP